MMTSTLDINIEKIRKSRVSELDINNLNMQSAWLHVLTDALGSLQAIVAGALIWRFGWYWVDPVASVLIGLLVIYSSWSLIRQSVTVLMEGAPGHIDVDEVRTSLPQLDPSTFP